MWYKSIQCSLGIVTLVVLAWLSPLLLGAVFIRERQVGIVVKKFGARSLPPGHLIALASEGWLSGRHLHRIALRLFPLAIRVNKVPLTVVPPGESPLVGGRRRANPLGAHSGQVVDCDNFQDATQFPGLG